MVPVAAAELGTAIAVDAHGPAALGFGVELGSLLLWATFTIVDLRRRQRAAAAARAQFEALLADHGIVVPPGTDADDGGDSA